VKIAIVHDWLTGMRGGERTLERMCRLFPDADLHALVWNPGSVSESIERHRISTSFLQRLPLAGRLYRWYLPLFPMAIERVDLSGYDAVISSTHAVAGGVRAPKGAFHLSYVYTPMRYIWELEETYFPPGRFPWPLSAYVRATCARLREWDVRASRRPDVMVAISEHVAGRIRRHYARDAEVVYPPVELSRFSPGSRSGDYDLLAGAFAPYKRGDLAIEACRRLGRRLVVVGSGQEEARLRANAGPGVQFLGWVPEEKLPRLYRDARCLIFPGEEDFGIVPVEAMASGCPVVALARGGALETVGRGMGHDAKEALAGGRPAAVPGGVLFSDQSVDGVVEALEMVSSARFDPAQLAAQSRPFGAQAFDAGFLSAFERGMGARATKQ
jgi:glycosyltransferase involved in cell wall biosynthesis